MRRNVPADEGVLSDKATKPGAGIKETSYISEINKNLTT
jgi:hypothetical protein